MNLFERGRLISWQETLKFYVQTLPDVLETHRGSFRDEFCKLFSEFGSSSADVKKALQACEKQTALLWATYEAFFQTSEEMGNAAAQFLAHLGGLEQVQYEIERTLDEVRGAVQ